MERIFLACSHQNEEIVEHALICIREIMTQEYEIMQVYFNKICEVTSACAKHSSPKVGAQAYEFWTTLVEDETERVLKGVNCVGFIHSCKESVIQLILEGLQIITFDVDDDDDDWGHAISAGCCLQKLALLIKNDVMEQVIAFSSTKIGSQNWHERYAALIALGSITDGPDKKAFMDVIISALPGLLQMFSEQNPKIREALAWVLQRICEHHPEIVSAPQVTAEFIPRVMEGIKDKPRISNQCCAAFQQLSIAVQPFNEEPNNCLSNYFFDIMQLLLANSARDDYLGTNIDLQQASYTAMTNMVQYCCSD